MRFLLNSAKPQPYGRTSRLSHKFRQLGRPTENSAAPGTKGSAISPNGSHIKSWGQQCSPNCGCVVRFEATIDPKTQTIVESSYVAKSVVALSENGKLKPVYTSRTNKPMFQDCKCSTVHTLAKEISEFLPNQRLDRLRNMTEFTFTRSSPAFRHAVLVGHKLRPTDTNCFDVLEEAFTAMVRGVMPTQTPKRLFSYEKMLVSELATPNWSTETNGDNEDPARLGMNRMGLSISSPRSISSTLSMFDVNADYWDSQESHSSDYVQDDHGHQTFPNSPPKVDWVSYVDELYQKEESA